MDDTKAPALVLDNCSKRFPGRAGADYLAVRELDLVVQPGRFVSIVGPTGCGKSTVLNMAAGLLQPSVGSVSTFGEPVRGVNSHAGYMFQQDAALPWKSVRANVALGLKIRGHDAKSIDEKVDEWLAKVGLSAFADRYPHQLSGGQRRRVAIAQVWITDPDIILMDEPFSALDVQTRQMMEGELLNLWHGTNKSVLFITHDLDEAIALSDEVVLLSAGPGSTIAGRFEIDLPRPRDLLEIKTDPRYVELYEQIWQRLKSEVLQSYASQVPA